MKHALIFAVVFHAQFAFLQELTRYHMYSDHFNIEAYTKQYERTFDAEGIIKQKNEYHALTISLYGIMCYDAYVQTKDVTYLKAVENQYKYFKDSSKYDLLFNEKGIGLPYKFKFNDLAPPWYSGLTQGIATSFLLRYAELKNSSEALDLAQKVAYLMLVPVENGGTLSKTPEGGLWIEEYPNTKKSKHVLNGFFNGLVGLKEYVDFFPEDTLALRIHNEVYHSFKSTISEYDNAKNWSSYDRNNKSISVAYLRIQLTQLDHLYAIYRDDFLLKQMMIWGRMMIGKTDKELKFYLNPNYQFTVGLTPNSTNEFDIDYSEIFAKYLIRNENVVCRDGKGKECSMGSSGVVLKKELLIIPERITYSVDIEVSNPGKKTEVCIYFNQGKLLKQNVNPLLEFQKFAVSSPIDSILIKRRKLFGRRINLREISFYDYTTFELPMFASINVTGIHELKSNKRYSFDSEQVGAEGAQLYWRYAEQRDKVTASKWIWNQSADLNDVFVPQKDGYFEFFISYPIHCSKSMMRNVKIVEIE